jgi:hypothetical protein
VLRATVYHVWGQLIELPPSSVSVSGFFVEMQMQDTPHQQKKWIGWLSDCCRMLPEGMGMSFGKKKRI